MYTSIALIALTGSVIAPTPEDVRWARSYDQARQTGMTENKPLAVIFGTGETGYDKVSREGQLSDEVMKTLGDKYVCLYVDVSTPTGKQLASQFAITRNSGVVLSDRSGKLQAFYHDGDMTNADLNKWASRFADPNVTVSTTVTNDSSAQVSNYPPSDRVSGSFGGYATGYSPGGYAPAWGGGGCPGGHCGGGHRRR
jgi:hypothetical protein